MANRFKDYRAQLKSNKTVVLSDDELKIYSRTANNEGVSHANVDWGDCVVFMGANKRNEVTDEDGPKFHTIQIKKRQSSEIWRENKKQKR